MSAQGQGLAMSGLAPGATAPPRAPAVPPGFALGRPAPLPASAPPTVPSPPPDPTGDEGRAGTVSDSASETPRLRHVLVPRKKVNMRLYPSHLELISSSAAAADVFITEFVADLVDQFGPRLAERGSLGPPPKRQRHAQFKVTFTVEVPVEQLRRLDRLAAKVAYGDRSRTVRALLDLFAAAPPGPHRPTGDGGGGGVADGAGAGT